MNTEIFLQMLNDKHCVNYEKLGYKYGKENLNQYINTLKSGFLTEIPYLSDKCSYIPSKTHLSSRRLKAFMKQSGLSLIHMEDEIISTLSIENINSSRDSVRNILKGYAPKTDDDKKAYGIKLGLDFISDKSNVINEENLHKLYMLSCGDYVDENNRLLPGNKYHHDKVYVMGSSVNVDILHEGADFKDIDKKIKNLINFINHDTKTDDIIKSIIAHYYLAYIHPYFDGNGRCARLLQMWVLIQQGYSASLYLPFSKYINEKKELYYKAFETVSKNAVISGVLDITAFIKFFIDNVIEKLDSSDSHGDIINQFEQLINIGIITKKEKELFYFVLSTYGKSDFSTKDLEKDFRNAAYATVRGFCIKLEKNGILKCTKYGNRFRYKLNV